MHLIGGSGLQTEGQLNVQLLSALVTKTHQPCWRAHSKMEANLYVLAWFSFHPTLKSCSMTLCLSNASSGFEAPRSEKCLKRFHCTPTANEEMKFAKYWKCMEMIHGLAEPCEDLSITVLRFRDSDLVLQWRAMISILVIPSAPFNHPNKRKTYSPLPVPWRTSLAPKNTCGTTMHLQFAMTIGPKGAAHTVPGTHQKNNRAQFHLPIQCHSLNIALDFSIAWVVPPPRIPVANEGLGWDPLLKT